MKKFCLLLIILVLFLFTSCAENKTFEIKGQKTEIKPYGLLNPEQKNDSIIYQISPGNLLCSVVFSETIVVPIYLFGWQFYEPTSKVNK